MGGRHVKGMIKCWEKKKEGQDTLEELAWKILIGNVIYNSVTINSL